ncbi:MAG: ATP-binding protein [Pirellulales bacterium]
MSVSHAPAARISPATGPWLVGALRRRYLWALGAVAALVLVDQAVVQPLLVRLNAYAPAINVAGRQRMLSQKLVKEALAWQTQADPVARARRRDEFEQTLRSWTAAHELLARGAEGFSGVGVDAPRVASAWSELGPHYSSMNAAAAALLPPQGALAPLEALLSAEPLYLTNMDRVVGLLEEEARGEVTRLRGLAFVIGAAILATLVGLGWGVVLPATRLIRSQFDELEQRVAERTSELAAANAELSQALEERRAAQADLHELGLQLAHAGRVSALGHLTAGLAHELNQPLATITNYAESADVLLDRAVVDPATLRQRVQEIRAAALRAGQIVRRMRDFVRPAAGVEQELELGQLVRDVLELCRPEAERVGAACVVRLGAAELPVRGDPIQLQQVLVNLVQNALHALRSMPVDQRRLGVRAEACAGEIRVTVSDSGPGLPAEQRERLGEPFVTTKADGLGLGLAICRVIINRHGGRLWAEPDASGACLTFSLPLSREHAAAESHADDCVRR